MLERAMPPSKSEVLMGTKAERYQEFLSEQSHEELEHIRGYIDGLLSCLQTRAAVQDAQRPHMAMPERRGAESRYQVGLAAHCWDPRIEQPADEDRVSIRVIDISLSGIRFISGAKMRPQEIVGMEFTGTEKPAKQILMEVMRVRPCRLPGREHYEVGCRALSGKVVLKARREAEYQETIHRMFSDRGEMLVLQLAVGLGSKTARNILKAEGFLVATVPMAGKVLPLLRSSELVSLPRVVICPASVLRPQAVWVRKLRDAFPQMALLAIAGKDNEYAAAKSIEQVDQVVRSRDLKKDLLKAIKCALFSRLAPRDYGLPASALKILLASGEEKKLRRMQTLLLGSEYRVDKVLSLSAAKRELQLQTFHVIIVDSDLLEEDPSGGIRGLRSSGGDLVVVVEIDGTSRGEKGVRLEADLLLARQASRSALLKTVERARRMYHQQAFVEESV